MANKSGEGYKTKITRSRFMSVRRPLRWCHDKRNGLLNFTFIFTLFCVGGAAIKSTLHVLTWQHCDTKLTLNAARYLHKLGRGLRCSAVQLNLPARRSRVRTPLWPSSFKETQMFLPRHSLKFNIVGSLCDREVACSDSDRQGSNFESCVWTAVSSHSSHHPQEILLTQFRLYVHKGGLTPHSFHFIYLHRLLVFVTS